MFGVSVDYEDLPPLIPVDMVDMLDILDMVDMLDMPDFHGFNPSPSLSIEYKNPIKDIMVGWEDVDAGYIEKLARVHFNEQYDKPRPRLNCNETRILVSQVLHDLERQATQSILTLNIRHGNSGDITLNFLDCVLEACKDVFQETQFF